jgi:F-type H+-transporting ATPase subunit epsilon
MPLPYTLEIYTPYRLFFSDSQVEAIVLTIADGEICVYANHDRFTAPVLCGVMRIKDIKGVWKIAFVNDGIIEVKRHKTVLLVESANWTEEIDRDRVIQSKNEADEILNSAPFYFERITAKQKIRRAEVRLKALDMASKQTPNGAAETPAAVV